MTDRQLARDYILDRLSAEDRDACERRFLFDPDFEAIMLEEERDVADDYANHLLEGNAIRSVRRRAARVPEFSFRLQFAQALRRAIGSDAFEPQPSFFTRLRAAMVPRPPIPPILVGALSGIGLMVVAAALVMLPSWRRQALAPPPAQALHAPAASPSAHPTQRASTPRLAAQSDRSDTPLEVAAGRSVPAPPTAAASTAAASTASFVLLADQQRGEQQAPVITLPPAIRHMRLQLTSEEGLETGRYTAVVSDAQGNAVATLPHLHTRQQAGRRFVWLPLDGSSLDAGEYVVELKQEIGASAPSLLHYRFSLVRG